MRASVFGAKRWCVFLIGLVGGGDIPVPRPVVAHDMVFLTNAHGPLAPIYAINLKATGDISLEEGQTTNEYVTWSLPKRGAYMPTPIVYGDRFYAVDHQTKTVHSDFEPGVMGSYAQAVFAALFREFHLEQPFSDEINADELELRGESSIGGEMCWVIHVVYRREPIAEATWYVGKNDFLPRGRLDGFSLPSGEKGGIFKQISQLTVAPEIAPKTFDLIVPKGYCQVDTPAP